jgi:hypothetical protein
LTVIGCQPSVLLIRNADDSWPIMLQAAKMHPAGGPGATLKVCGLAGVLTLGLLGWHLRRGPATPAYTQAVVEHGEYCQNHQRLVVRVPFTPCQRGSTTKMW